MSQWQAFGKCCLEALLQGLLNLYKMQVFASRSMRHPVVHLQGDHIKVITCKLVQAAVTAPSSSAGPEVTHISVCSLGKRQSQ